MKTTAKVLLGVSLALLAAGTALNMVGASMGGREESKTQFDSSMFLPGTFHLGEGRGIHISPGRMQIGEQGEFSFSDTLEVALSPFTDLEVEVDLASVLVAEGEDYTVDLSWESDRFRLFYEVEDGKLKIWSEGQDGYGKVTDVSADVIITIPADAELGEVDISTDLGSVIWEATASAREAELLSGLGSVTCSGLLAWELEGSSDLGSVDITLPGPRKDFRWELESDMGQLSLDCEPQSGGIGDLLIAGGTGERLVKASTDLGSVNVSFS